MATVFFYYLDANFNLFQYDDTGKPSQINTPGTIQDFTYDMASQTLYILLSQDIQKLNFIRAKLFSSLKKIEISEIGNKLQKEIDNCQ